MQPDNKSSPDKKQPSLTVLRQRKLLLSIAAARKRFRREFAARLRSLRDKTRKRSFFYQLAKIHREDRLALPPDWRNRWRLDQGKPVVNVDNVVIAFEEDFYLSWRIVLAGGKLCHVWTDADPPQVFTRADGRAVIEYLAEIGLVGVDASTLKEAMLIVAHNGAAPTRTRENG